MKKLIAALVAVLTVMALFAGCMGGDQDNNLPVNVGDATPKPDTTGDPTGTGDQTVLAELTREPLGGKGMIAAGSIHNVGLRTNGTVISAGHDQYGQRRLSDWQDITFVAVNKSATIGVKADGSALFAGQMAGSEAVSGWGNVYMVAMGGDFAAALLNDGTVTATSGAPAEIASWSDIVWLAAGESFVIGLKSDSTVVASNGAPDVSGWKGMVKIAAGADRAAAITTEGKIVATVDTAAFDANSDYVDVSVGQAGMAAVRQDGSVVAAIEAQPNNDPLIPADSKDIIAVSNAVSVSVGEKHAVVMDRNGNAIAYGDNTELQCDVGTFNLRPYVETIDGANYVRGLDVGMNVARAKELVALFTNASEVKIAKADGSDAADADIVATGMKVSADGSEIGAIVIMGDGNGDGAITADDVSLVDAIVTNKSELSGANLRAMQLSRSYEGNKPACLVQDRSTLNDYIAGTGRIDQFGKKSRDTYTDRYMDAYNANPDTVGYIQILGTNIDYQIMFDKTTGKWYYNDHTPEKKAAESGSIYAYYYGQQKNNVVTGHNSRPSGSMFHQLHHIQEFNLGKTTCDHKKHCGKELSNLPDLNIYAERVWDIYLYGEEARYEIFGMFETSAPSSMEVLKEYTWYGDHEKTTDEEIQKWLDEVKKNTKDISGMEFDSEVTVNDQYMTIFTCGNEHDDAAKFARLYFMLKKVDY